MKRILFCILVTLAGRSFAEDGSQLWLRHAREQGMPQAGITLGATPGSCSETDSATLNLAVSELRSRWTGGSVELRCVAGATEGVGSFCVEKQAVGPDAEDHFVVTASQPIGLLYGAYFMLRAQSRADVCLCNTLPPSHRLQQAPAVPLRCLAGQDVLFDLLKEGRVSDYARACASVGINGVTLKERRHLSSSYINKLEEIRALLAPYGIRILKADSLSHQFLPLLQADADSRLYTYVPKGWADKLQHISDATAIVAEVPVSDDDSWCHNDELLAQACWFAAGRLAWQPDLSAEQLAYEWLAGTFSENPLFVMPVRTALLQCDGSADALQTLLEVWRDAAASIDDERFGMVEKMLCDQLDQGEN